MRLVADLVFIIVVAVLVVLVHALHARAAEQCDLPERAPQCTLPARAWTLPRLMEYASRNGDVLTIWVNVPRPAQPQTAWWHCRSFEGDETPRTILLYPDGRREVRYPVSRSFSPPVMHWMPRYGGGGC